MMTVKKPVKKPLVKKTTKAKAKPKAKPKKLTFKQISVECKSSARMGRPTKYRPEFPEMIYNFFDQPATIDKEVYNNQGEKIMATVATPYLSLASFAVYIGVTSSTIRDWASSTDDEGHKKYPDFSAAYQCVKEMQSANLVINGASGAYKENFTKFLAINNHGYQERQTQDINLTAKGISHIDSNMDPSDAARAYADAMNNDS